MTRSAEHDSTLIPAPSPWAAGTGPVCRIEQVYRHGEDEVAGSVRAHRQAAVTAAYHRGIAAGGTPVLIAWCRPHPGDPVTVLAGGNVRHSTAPAPLIFPPDTRGRPAPAGTDLLHAMNAWVPIAGVIDDLIAQKSTESDRWLPVPLEHTLLSAWHEAFAWLLVAQPIPHVDLDKLAKSLAADERDARARDSSPEYIVRAERLARQHREARAGSTRGLWNVRLLAGADDPVSAATVAGLLAAGTDLHGTPYALAPAGQAMPLHEALNTTLPLPKSPSTGISSPSRDVHEYPFTASSALVTALAQVPRTEIPGVHVIERPTFDVAAETTTGPSIDLGRVLDHNEQPAGILRVSHDTLNRHTFVCGATGSGKSQTVRGILEALATGPIPIPWLVVEPAKAEYTRMAGRLAHHVTVQAIRPGDPDSIPGCLNPLEPAPGFPLQTHIDLTRALFLAAFDAYEPFPQVLSHALDQCYKDVGWDVALSEPTRPSVTPHYPSLEDLRRTALDVVDHIGYSKEITDNVHGFIDVRIGSLTLGTPGRFFHGGHPLDIEDLLIRNTVLELEDIGNDQDKAFVIGAILIRISEHLRVRDREQPATGLRHVTVIEEAHRLLKRVDADSPSAHAIELFAELLAEVRAYGEGIIVAEQIPAKIITDVVKNSALKIMHRLPADDDRHLVGATMNLTDEQSRYVVTLLPGRAAVFTDGMDHPVLAAMPLGVDRETDHGVNRTPAVLGPHSPACPATCQRRPCTLREMALGARIAQDPKITLWIELTTIAHLVGEPAPTPSHVWLTGLRGPGDSRVLRCAVAQRIQTAVNERYTNLVGYFQPEKFVEHLSQHATDILADHAGTCLDSEPQWQAGRYRWIDVLRSLREQAATADSDQPHPDSDIWRQRGLTLPTAGSTSQMEALRRHQDSWKPPREVIAGRNTPTTVEAAICALSPAPDETTRFNEATEHLTLSWAWPLVIPGLLSDNAAGDS
jgi:uncharacterized protein